MTLGDKTVPVQPFTKLKSVSGYHGVKAEPGDNVGFNVRGLAQLTSAVVTLQDTDNEPSA